MFIEGQLGKNIWYQQSQSSHMEQVNHLFKESRVNHFNVAHIDERSVEGLDSLVQQLLHICSPHAGVQCLFDIVTSDSSAYKKLVHPIASYLAKKYNFNNPIVYLSFAGG